MMDFSGGREISAAGNNMISNCKTCDAVIAYRVGTFYAANAYGGWTDPTGIDTDGIAKPRNILLQHNKVAGSAPGSIEEGAALATHMEGPIIYMNNVASKYNVFGAGSDLQDSNRLV